MKRYNAFREYFEEIAEGVKIMSIIVIAVMIVVTAIFGVGFLIVSPFYTVPKKTINTTEKCYTCTMDGEEITCKEVGDDCDKR